jgi:hypothetical protein
VSTLMCSPVANLGIAAWYEREAVGLGFHFRRCERFERLEETRRSPGIMVGRNVAVRGQTLPAARADPAARSRCRSPISRS